MVGLICFHEKKIRLYWAFKIFCSTAKEVSLILLEETVFIFSFLRIKLNILEVVTSRFFSTFYFQGSIFQAYGISLNCSSSISNFEYHELRSHLPYFLGFFRFNSSAAGHVEKQPSSSQILAVFSNSFEGYIRG